MWGADAVSGMQPITGNLKGAVSSELVVYAVKHFFVYDEIQHYHDGFEFRLGQIPGLDWHCGELFQDGVAALHTAYVSSPLNKERFIPGLSDSHVVEDVSATPD